MAGTFVALLVTVCLDLSKPGTCVTEQIVDNAVEPSLTMARCLNGSEAQVTIKDWWENHPLYHDWHIRGYGCKIGNQQEPKKGSA